MPRLITLGKTFCAIVIFCAVQPASAGTYSQNFNSFALGATNFGDGSQLFSSEPGIAKVEDPSLEELQLSQWDTTNTTRAAFLLPDLDPGTLIGGFSASWVSPVYGNFPSASLGFSFSLGALRSNDLASAAYTQERGFNTGLSFCAHTFPTATTPGWYVRHNGSILATVTNDPVATWGNFSATRHAFQVSWNMFDGMSASQDGVVIFTNVPTPGFQPQAGDSFAWATRAGAGIAETFRIDNLSVTTVPSGPPIIATATATNALLPIVTLMSGVNGRGLATTVICEMGTNASYGISATNFIPGTNWEGATNGLITYFTNSFPFDTDRSIPLYARFTASNALGTTITNFSFASSSFERRLGSEVARSSGVWLDLNDDGLLDVAVAGYGLAGSSNGKVFLNPGANTNWVSTDCFKTFRCSISVGDFDNDNRPDSFWVGAKDNAYYPDNGYPATILWGVPTNQINQFGSAAQALLFPFHLDQGRAVIRDFDHDGRQDVLMTGTMINSGASTNPLIVNGTVSRMVRNEFSGVRNSSNFKFMKSGLPAMGIGVPQESVNGGWFFSDGDLDGDGFPDIYTYGYPKPDAFNDLGWGIYRSDGEMGMLPVATGSRELGDINGAGASSIWADFNGDGRDDLLVAEGNFQFGVPPFLRIFLNDGQGDLTNSGWSLPVPPLGVPTVTAGDIYNHGRNDIVIMGRDWARDGQALPARILRNEGGGVFTSQDFGFPPEQTDSYQGAGLQLADFDKDGRLDLMIVGGRNSGAETFCVYRNELDIPSNAPPQAPMNLSTVVGPGTVTFNWGSATDDITPTNLLTYNLRVGTNLLGTSVVSPLANVTNGWRKVTGPGNCRHVFSTLYRLPPGTYHWSVQAVDGAFAGGAWATEQTFTITESERPVLGLNSSNTEKTLHWPVRFNDYTLQQSSSLAVTNWITVTNVALADDGKFNVSLTNEPVARFFRLRK